MDFAKNPEAPPDRPGDGLLAKSTTSGVCPLCPVHCYDVVIHGTDAGLQIKADGCPIADRFVHHPDLKTPFDSFAGKLIATAGVDLVIARELERRDAAGEIRVALIENPSIAAFQTAAISDGTFAATIGDIRAHADRVLLLGEVEKTWPRLRHHLTDPDRPSQLIDTIGQLDADAAAGWLCGDVPTVLDGEFQYAAVVVGPDAFAAGEEDLVAAMLHRWLRSVNQTRRAVGMTLDAAATIRSVWLWRRNVSPPPLGSRTADVSLSPGDGHPVGGLDYDSVVIRGDGSVTLPLRLPA